MSNSTCGACARAIGYQEDVRCQQCGESFHVECVRTTVQGGQAAALTIGGTWNCQACNAISIDGQADSNLRPHGNMDRAQLADTSLNTSHFEQIMMQFSMLNAAVGDCNSKIAETQVMFAQQGNLISECRDDITALREENAELRCRVAFLEERLSMMTPHRIIMEAKDRSERERNVIMWGVPESGDSLADSRIVAEILDCITEIPEGGVEAVDRIGVRQRSSFRPLKVRLNSLDLKIAILRSKARLNASKYKKVYLRSDLTVQQFDMLKAARGELRDRENKGEADLKIIYRNGEPVVTATRQSKVRKGSPTRGCSQSQANPDPRVDRIAIETSMGTDSQPSQQPQGAPSLRGSSHSASQSLQLAQDKQKRSREEDDSPKRELGVKVSNQSTTR